SALLDRVSLTREEVDSQASEIYERLGKIALRNKRFSAAKTYFTNAQAKARDSDPGRARRLGFHLAQVLTRQRDYQAALQRIDEYLLTQPQGTEAYQLRIDILRNLKRDSEVLSFLRDSADRDPNNETLKLFLANEYKRAGDRREAETLFVQ